MNFSDGIHCVQIRYSQGVVLATSFAISLIRNVRGADADLGRMRGYISFLNNSAESSPIIWKFYSIMFTSLCRITPENYNK